MLLFSGLGFFSLSSRSTRSCLLVSRGRRTRLIHTALRTRLCGRPFSLSRQSPDDRRPAFPDGPGGIAPPTVLCVLPFSARLVPSRPGRGPPLPRASSRCRNGSFDRWRTLCGRSSQQWWTFRPTDRHCHVIDTTATHGLTPAACATRSYERGRCRISRARHQSNLPSSLCAMHSLVVLA